MAQENKADGEAGGRRAAALLSAALCAESSHATLNEDWAKVDLKLAFRNSFSPSSLITVHAQIKTGVSYKAKSTTPQVVTLQNVDDATVGALQDGTQPALIAWVPPSGSQRIYWHLVKPRGSKNLPIKIPRSNYVRPSLQIDISRHHVYLSNRKGFPQITLPSPVPQDLRANAIAEYKKLQHAPISNPVCGSVFVTRRGWRHVTRRSRQSLKRERSFMLLPYLRTILGHSPSRYLVTKPLVRLVGARIHETREVLLWYEHAIKLNDIASEVLVRIVEEIDYPKSWQCQPLGVKDISCKRTLLSWWFKEQEKTDSNLGDPH